MNRRIKKRVLQLLEGDLETARRELGHYDEKGLINPLFSAIYRSEEKLRWQGIRIFGETLSRLADKDLEAARIVMRRLIWSLNDESGGIGWGAPEAMAEGMFQHDILCDEYLHMLISYMRPDGPLAHQDGNFLELPELQRGVIWGICRLAGKRAGLLVEKGVKDDLLRYLDAKDGVVRGFAAMGLGMLGAIEAEDKLAAMVDDEREVSWFKDGRLLRVSVGQLVKTALEQLKILKAA